MLRYDTISVNCCSSTSHRILLFYIVSIVEQAGLSLTCSKMKRNEIGKNKKKFTGRWPLGRVGRGTGNTGFFSGLRLFFKTSE